MLNQHEIDKFIDEISSDSMASVSQQQSKVFIQDTFIKQENEKLQQENEKMRKNTFELLKMASAVLENNRSYSAEKIKLEKELLVKQNEFDKLQLNYLDLQSKYTEENNRSINQIFHQDQTISQLKENQKVEHEDYLNLSQDYLSLLSDVTCFFNYDVKKHQNQIIIKTEKFLYNCYKGEYKRPKIARRRPLLSQDDDILSVLSSVSSRSKKRPKSKKEPSSSTKKAKTDINDFQSISQVASPSRVMSCFDEDSSSGFSAYTDSGISFNETLSPSAKSLAHQCRCYEEILPTLISVGTNTDQHVEELPSLPLMSNYIDDLAYDAMGEQIENCLDLESEDLSGHRENILIETDIVDGKIF